MKLCNDIEQGGAKMINLDNYVLSLNAKWITTAFSMTQNKLLVIFEN